MGFIIPGCRTKDFHKISSIHRKTATPHNEKTRNKKKYNQHVKNLLAQQQVECTSYKNNLTIETIPAIVKKAPLRECLSLQHLPIEILEIIFIYCGKNNVLPLLNRYFLEIFSNPSSKLVLKYIMHTHIHYVDNKNSVFFSLSALNNKLLLSVINNNLFTIFKNVTNVVTHEDEIRYYRTDEPSITLKKTKVPAFPAIFYNDADIIKEYIFDPLKNGDLYVTTSIITYLSHTHSIGFQSHDSLISKIVEVYHNNVETYFTSHLSNVLKTLIHYLAPNGEAHFLSTSEPLIKFIKSLNHNFPHDNMIYQQEPHFDILYARQTISNTYKNDKLTYRDIKREMIKEFANICYPCDNNYVVGCYSDDELWYTLKESGDMVLMKWFWDRGGVPSIYIMNS
ncbi:uncharacterized protein SCDLUD_003926 [Saccharomycodes ludwigii]|uniref:uncharacterized protein n=1 Tax=Saccharomycodes ludwigii TaxID=36035 RepID=UPI001E833CEC|nr:hypothetical protein SCDLUD_003926 [Saccharomycodes ludwigii]KAH3899645.1 hypothetical protein SCDLUD_003926 [Saccharomycodes ludwigii]